MKLIKTYQKILKNNGINWKNSFIIWEIPKHIQADLALNILPLVCKTKKTLEETVIQVSNELLKNVQKK